MLRWERGVAGIRQADALRQAVAADGLCREVQAGRIQGGAGFGADALHGELSRCAALRRRAADAQAGAAAAGAGRGRRLRALRCTRPVSARPMGRRSACWSTALSAPTTQAQPAYRIDGALVGAEAFYAVACDPRRHVVVEACAGAGKTWMLVSRILRALLDGAEPQEILAITFTRKAAGEMRTRLNEWLTALSADGGSDADRVLALQQRGLHAATAQALAPALADLQQRLQQVGRS
eukprot:gene58501-80104_t